MCKGIAFVLALTAAFGFVPLAQAAVLYDFEAPAYTAGVAVDSQNGWIAAGGGSVANPKVVATPVGMPASAGSQVTQLGWYTDHSMIGAGFTDVTTLSWLVLYSPQSDSSGSLVTFDLYGKSANTAGKLSSTQVMPSNKIHYDFGGGDAYLHDSNTTNPMAWQVTETIDFTTQKYKVVWTDLGTSTSYDTGYVNFINSCTKAEAEANAYFSAGCPFQTGNGTQYMDNVGVNVTPEPSTFVLLSTGLLGLLAFAWKKKRK